MEMNGLQRLFASKYDLLRKKRREWRELGVTASCWSRPRRIFGRLEHFETDPTEPLPID